MLRRLALVARAEELATPEELSIARAVGRLLAEHSIILVHDGRELGAIGLAAESCDEAGGRVIVSDLTTSASIESIDAFLALPHGFATLEAAFAIWAHPGAAGRELPVGLLDDGDYYSALLQGSPDSALDRFVHESQRGRLIIAKRAEELLRRLADYKPPETRRGNHFD